MSEFKSQGVELKSRNVLVTGGAGFIGSHVTQGALRAGAKVRVLDDLSGSGSWRRLTHVADDCERVEASILDADALNRACEGIDTIFHLAAAVSVPESVSRPMEYHATDATGTLCLLEAARRAAVRRIVYSSTSALYGDAPEQPKHESHRAMPTSPYGVAKYAGELYMGAYATLHGLETISLRYFNVFGAGQDPKSQYGAAIPNIVSRIASGQRPTIYGDGEQTRDFCHVDNIVFANLLAANAVGVKGDAVNVACGREVSLNELVRVTNRLVGKIVEPIYDPPRPGDIRVSYADISAAREVIGYAPLIHFDEALAKTLPSYM